MARMFKHFGTFPISKPFRSIGFGMAAVVVISLVILALFYLQEAFNYNFHTVVEGRIYRASQFDKAAWGTTIQRYKIKSILNLRGASTNSWYMDESSVAKDSGVRLFDFPLSASREISDLEMVSLVEILKSAPKPMLIHCKSGADRTGLASSLYLYAVEEKPAELASGQLSFLFGHVPAIIPYDTRMMDVSFWNYVRNHSVDKTIEVSLIKEECSKAGSAQLVDE